MDDVVNRLAREFAEAIGSAVAKDSRVEACRERARAAGYDMRVSLEAEIGFGDRLGSPAPGAAPPACLDVTANDRRFLRSLRIAADGINQTVE